MKQCIYRAMCWVVVTIVCAALGAPEARAQIAGTESIASVYATRDGVAGYDSTASTLRFFTVSDATLREGRSFSVEGQVMGLVEVPDGYVYATGMGRGDLSAPLRIRKVAKDGSRREIIFERSGERNQLTKLAWNGDRLWLDFFDSKYFTSIGFLSPVASGPWSYTQVALERMGDSMDVVGDLVVVGRSYGDQQGQDGDLLIFQGGSKTRLPSYRGVRGVALLSNGTDAPSIVIGDGWHQNYGQFAQARVSLLRKRVGEPRYALEILDQDSGNTDFSRFFEFSIAGRRFVAARGSASVVVYGPEGEWKKTEIYQQAIRDVVMDVALARVDSGRAFFVVVDRGVRLVSFTPAG